MFSTLHSTPQPPQRPNYDITLLQIALASVGPSAVLLHHHMTTSYTINARSGVVICTHITKKLIKTLTR